MTILSIKDVAKIDNMESMPRGTGARFLECSTHEYSKDGEMNLEYIAFKWRRKLPAGIPSWHVMIMF